MKRMNECFTAEQDDCINLISSLLMAALIGALVSSGIPIIYPDFPGTAIAALSLIGGLLSGMMGLLCLYSSLLEFIWFRKARKHNAKLRSYDSIISFASDCRK